MKKHTFNILLVLVLPLACLGALANDQTVKIKTKGNISLESENGDYSFQLRGRLQYDYNYAELDNVVDEDTFTARRARLSFRGTIKDFSYKMDFNIGNNNGGNPTDLYITYNGWGDSAKVSMGRQKMPMGLDRISSSKNNPFLERSALTERHTASHNYGVMFHGRKKDFLYEVAVFEDESSVNTDNDFGYGARAVWSKQRQQQLYHLGASYIDRGVIRCEVDGITNCLDVKNFGAEAAYVNGPLHFQTEYFRSKENAINTDGFYAQAGWVITGETRPYSRKRSSFTGIKPKSTLGAWEVVIRYEDGDGDYSDIELSRSNSSAIGIGLNWYYNSNVRFGMNYTVGDNNDNNSSGSEFRIRTQLLL